MITKIGIININVYLKNNILSDITILHLHVTF